MLFQYVAWFRDPALPQDDEDYEWPACFLVDGESSDAARAWGDRLAREYAPRANQLFLWSRVEPPSRDASQPIVVVGEEASDRKIGW